MRRICAPALKRRIGGGLVYTFGNFSVDTGAFELRSDGEPRPVEPRVFDLIAHLAAHPQEVLTRDELVASVWRGRIVSDATVATCVKNARKALGDTGNDQGLIQTVRGRGYRLAATVARSGGPEQKVSPGRTPDPADVAHAEAGAEPSLVILPFRCLSGGSELQRVADGLTADLGTVLTRVPLLRLRAQTEHYGGRPVPPSARQLHEELGVDFVVDGSIQDGAGRARVNVQLSDAKTGFRLWAESFELNESPPESLDGGVARIVGKLEPQLHKAMYRAVCAAGEEPTARQLFLEASGLLVTQGWHHGSFPQAAALLRRSAELDPDFALAPSLLSLLLGFGARVGLHEDAVGAGAEALEAAERALALDSMDSTVVGLTGCALADIGHLDRGEALLQSAIDLNPANAQAWVALGAVRLARRDTAGAVAKLSHGIGISPLDSRLSVWGALLSVAHLASGDLEAACEAAEAACRRNDRTYLPRVALAGARLARRDAGAALRALADARRAKPDLTPNQVQALLGKKLAGSLLALEEKLGQERPA